MRVILYATLLSAIPVVVIAAFDSFADSSCMTVINECLAKWLPSEQETVDSDTSHQEAFCTCWLGLQAGDCRDIAGKNEGGSEKYATCGAGSTLEHQAFITISIGLLLGIRNYFFNT